MKFQLKLASTSKIEKITSDCLVCTTSCITKLNLNKDTLNFINKLVMQEELLEERNVNKTILLFNPPGISTKRLLLISTGKSNLLSEHQFIELIKSIANNLMKYNVNNISICFDHCNVKNKPSDWQIYQAAITLQNSIYSFENYKSKKSNHNKFKVNTIDLLINDSLKLLATKSLQQALAVGASCNFAKDLANTPPNVCTTSFLAKAATQLKKKSNKVKLSILEKKSLEKLNMGAFLAIAQGSLQPPKLICLEYNGLKNSKTPKKAKDKQPIVLIGKGITFDTGGNSLKPSNSMVGMKYDMCGAATVLGLINFAIEANLEINLVGIVPTTENMPGRHACRPDDVVTTMSGLTVEILNTDAEGRLILCDALTYCKKFDPKYVIDIATLTGSCAATLGQHYSGLFANHQSLANDILAAGITVNDKAWQLPMTEEYYKQLDSDVADVANIGGPQAGSITAACFLAKFAENYKWVHLDIAGTAYYSEGKINRTASGRPIPMLAQYLINQVDGA